MVDATFSSSTFLLQKNVASRHRRRHNTTFIIDTSNDDIPIMMLQLRGGSKRNSNINDNDASHNHSTTICKLNLNDRGSKVNNNNVGIIINDTKVEFLYNNDTLSTCDHDCDSTIEIRKSHGEEHKKTKKESSQSTNVNQNHKLKNNAHTGKEQRKKEKRKSKSSITTKRTKTKYTGGGKQGECLRRIKHEWKQIIKLGIAYDWVTQQTITIKGKHSTSGQEELKNDDLFYRYNYIRVGPFRNNLLHWHFSIQGPKNSVYEDGIYHGRIILPKSYPLSPPRVQLLTPSGRFIPGDDICLSASAFHPETWTPRWTILSLIEALRMHMLTTANENGGVHASDESRRKFAAHSRSWKMGCLNHEQMVNNGLFCPKPIIEANDDE